MEQVIQILQSISSLIWPGGLIAIVFGFIGAGLVIYIINNFSHKSILSEDSVDDKMLKLLSDKIATLLRTDNPDKRLIQLQHIVQLAKLIDSEVLKSIFNDAIRFGNPQVRGEIFYALGMSEDISFIPLLRERIDDPDPWASKQAKEAIERLEQIELSQRSVSSANTEELLEKFTNLESEFYKLRSSIEQSNKI